MARRLRAQKTPDDAPRQAVRLLGQLILACLAVAVILGYSKYGEPLWAGARALFLPAGLLAILQSTMLGGRRASPIVGVPPNRALAPSLFTCGVGLAALGLEHLDADRSWSVFAIPMIVLLGTLSLREAYRGNDSVLLKQPLGRRERFVVRAVFWMLGLCWPLVVLFALGVQPG